MGNVNEKSTENPYYRFKWNRGLRNLLLLQIDLPSVILWSHSVLNLFYLFQGLFHIYSIKSYFTERFKIPRFKGIPCFLLSLVCKSLSDTKEKHIKSFSSVKCNTVSILCNLYFLSKAYLSKSLNPFPSDFFSFNILWKTQTFGLSKDEIQKNTQSISVLTFMHDHMIMKIIKLQGRLYPFTYS